MNLKNAKILPMKTVVVAVLFVTFGPASQAADKWNDALSASTSAAAKPLEIATASGLPVTNPTATLARQIVASHLRQIHRAEVMVNSITLESYWKNVFAQAGHPDLYDSALPDIQTALEAGLSPYLRGEIITAASFGSAALKALEEQPVPIVPTPLEADLTRR
jgi:hypothetical protein